MTPVRGFSQNAYVVVPGSVPVSEHTKIAECFANQIPVMRDFPGETRLLAGEVASVSELLNWCVTVGPHLFRELAMWLSSLYVGKKFVDGFATEAGKDLWKGVKLLCAYVSKNTFSTDKHSKKVSLISNGTEEGSQLYYDLVIDLWVPPTEAALATMFDGLERRIMPLFACVAASTADRISAAASVRDHDQGRWFIAFWNGGPSFIVDTTKLEFQLNSRPQNEKSKPLEASAHCCFQQCGLTPGIPYELKLPPT